MKKRLFAFALLAIAALSCEKDPCGAVGNKTGTPISSLTLVFSNDVLGEMDFCGCRDKQNGGFARRSTWLSELRRGKSAVVVVDAGDLFAPDFRVEPFMKEQLEERALTAGECARKMGFDAVTIGDRDLLLGLDVLKRIESLGLPIVCTNLVDSAGSTPIFPTCRIVEKGGIRIGMIGLMPATGGSESGAYRILDPAGAAQRELRKIGKEADLVICLSHLGEKSDLRLAGSMEGNRIVVGAGYSTTVVRPLLKGARIFTAPKKGRTAEFVEVSFDRKGGVTALLFDRQRVFLDEKIGKDPAIEEILKLHHEKIRKINQNVEIPVSGGEGPTYAGDSACRKCHEESHRSWAVTSHAKAIESLAGKNRDRDLECVRCHVTGYGSPGGFLDFKGSIAMAGVQCESCHGPGVCRPEEPGFSRDARVPESVCIRCHDEEYSEPFMYAPMKNRILHKSPSND